MNKIKFEKFKFILLLSTTFGVCANIVRLFDNQPLRIFGDFLVIILGILTVYLFFWTLSEKANPLFKSD